MSSLDSRPLFIFEMANNHMGDVNHGLRIVREFAEVARQFEFGFAFKMQYRDLPTCIHPDYRTRYDHKFVKRFSETALSHDDLKRIKDEISRAGMVSICTPWDEPSVDLIERHGFDVLKIPSCYLTDWSLLERIVKSDKPAIASVAGSPLEEIDKVVSFFEHRNKRFMLMHCVGEYPTRPAQFQLNQIDLLKRRYPRVEVGYSTHEDPDNVDAVKMAIAKGASIFEKHVGVPTDTIKLNAYSATPAQAFRWLSAAREALEACGVVDRRYEPSALEVSTLRALARGAFAAQPIAQGERIDLAKLFLAMPCQDGQVVGSDLSKYTDFVANRPLAANEPILWADVTRADKWKKVRSIVDQVKGMLRKSGVIVPSQLELEISHHYGIEQFDRYGSTTVTVVNRGYCKRVIVLLPGQSHPEQYHLEKDETYHLLYGDMTLSLDGQERQPQVNDVIVIERGTRHAFSTRDGVIIEEISSAYSPTDSYYTDASITQNKARKTFVTYWMD